MPEYLAPGVYVEETSFRAKSIEGVGTSTTAFVGPTLRGPIASIERDGAGNPPAAPELLTSYADFERIYGGLEDLRFGSGNTGATNYLAHSVLHFFNEGGARLYVARVANAASEAASGNLGQAPANGREVFLRSRFAGHHGNSQRASRANGRVASGRVTVTETAADTSVEQLEGQIDGVLLQVTDPSARPATIAGGPLPVDLTTVVRDPADALVLNLTVQGQLRSLRFEGQPARVTGGVDLLDPETVEATNREFRVQVNGRVQVVRLPVGDTAAADVPGVLNALLTGVTAALDGDRLVLTTARRGTSASIEVMTARFGFQAGDSHAPAFDNDQNNVADLAAVTLEDLRARVAAQFGANVAPDVQVNETGGSRFALATSRADRGSTLTIADVDPAADEVSIHQALGLPGSGDPAGSATGAGAPEVLYERATANDGTVEWLENGDPNTRVRNPALGSRALRTLSFSIEVAGVDRLTADLAYGREHPRYGPTILPANPATRADAMFQPLWLDVGGTVTSTGLRAALFPAARARTVDGRRVVEHDLTGGTDGEFPIVGTPTDVGSYAAAFELLRGLDDVSIVAAPGHSDFPTARAIRNALVAHAHQPHAYRIAVLDSPPRQLPGDVRAYRAEVDSHRAALYYPWVTVSNPLARPGRDDVSAELNLPPSGFLCGIYARNDVEQGVSKAPANEVVRGALRFESDVNQAQQQLLNPLGVNCLRYLTGRGNRVWGARTATSDPEWKYVNVRRYFLYLESSIERGTQWAVFENNGPRLWTNVRETVEAFLQNEWVSGSLLGSTPKEAFFVRCDRTTMTQNDLDNGRLICLIGVAALKPAEFVIFRIGQKTADDRS